MSSEDHYIIAGLGNPGPEYSRTRHNVGWMIIDRLAQAQGISLKMKRGGEVGEVRLGPARVLLVKPATYVNTSGKAIKTLADKDGVEAPRVIIVHDDLDLEFGELRIKASGRSGGHRGIDSIITALGSEEFPRVKVGIGRPPGRMDPSEFVLKRFSRVEAPDIDVALAEAAEAALAIIELGLEAAMNRYNQRKV